MNLMINTLFANRYGLVAGLILTFLCDNYLQVKIMKPKENFFDGEYWSLMTKHAFYCWFPFLSLDEIKAALEILSQNKAIEIKQIQRFEQTYFAIRVFGGVLCEGGY
ncbi:MAG: hypothetical protein SOZ27_06220 [Spirochaetia bacterium]|nr:hypothetical protein [Spirochaetia bacterium]